jgi:hypothetical protein
MKKQMYGTMTPVKLMATSQGIGLMEMKGVSMKAEKMELTADMVTEAITNQSTTMKSAIIGSHFKVEDQKAICEMIDSIVTAHKSMTKYSTGNIGEWSRSTAQCLQSTLFSMIDAIRGGPKTLQELAHESYVITHKENDRLMELLKLLGVDEQQLEKMTKGSKEYSSIGGKEVPMDDDKE